MELRQHMDNEDGKLFIEVHNQLPLNYSKAVGIISFYVKNHLGVFEHERDWTLECWLNKSEKKKRNRTCGVQLKRPNKKRVFVSKESRNVDGAVGHCLKILKKIIASES